MQDEWEEYQDLEEKEEEEVSRKSVNMLTTALSFKSLP